LAPRPLHSTYILSATLSLHPEIPDQPALPTRWQRANSGRDPLLSIVCKHPVSPVVMITVMIYTSTFGVAGCISSLMLVAAVVAPTHTAEVFCPFRASRFGISIPLYTPLWSCKDGLHVQVYCEHDCQISTRGAQDKPGLLRTFVADLVLASFGEMERSLMLLRFGTPPGVVSAPNGVVEMMVLIDHASDGGFSMVASLMVLQAAGPCLHGRATQ
jgi:hypothetical protein